MSLHLNVYLKIIPCIVRICYPPEIENGSVINEEMLTEGSFAHYECDKGLELEESQEFICLSSGLWSGSPPVCRGKRCST